MKVNHFRKLKEGPYIQLADNPVCSAASLQPRKWVCQYGHGVSVAVH